MSKKSSDKSVAEARPIGQGKDPLAEGNTLKNPSNTEAETHYDVKERGEDVQKAEHTINGKDANLRALEHNAKSSNVKMADNNLSPEEQDAVAQNRQESDPLTKAANKKAA